MFSTARIAAQSFCLEANKMGSVSLTLGVPKGFKGALGTNPIHSKAEGTHNQKTTAVLLFGAGLSDELCLGFHFSVIF